MAAREGLLAPLDGKSPLLFILAGALLSVFAINTSLEAFAGTFYPPVQSVVGPAGFLLGVLGLLGLVPTLTERAGTLARAAAVVAVVPGVAWLVIVVGGIAETVGVLPPAESFLPIAVFVVLFVSTFVTYLLFGAVSLYVGLRPRVAGVFLLVPAASFGLLIAGAVPNFVVDAGHAVGHLGAGIALWLGGLATDRPDRTDESPA